MQQHCTIVIIDEHSHISQHCVLTLSLLLLLLHHITDTQDWILEDAM
jgi:hypothetical protein